MASTSYLDRLLDSLTESFTRKIASAVAHLFLLSVAAVATAQPPPDLATKAEAYIKAARIQGSVLLARNGEVILGKGYGLANIEFDAANTPATKFRLGSITKQFTGAAILQLQEKENLWRAIEEDAVPIVLSNSDEASNIGKVGKELLELVLVAN